LYRRSLLTLVAVLAVVAAVAPAPSDVARKARSLVVGRSSCQSDRRQRAQIASVSTTDTGQVKRRLWHRYTVASLRLLAVVLLLELVE